MISDLPSTWEFTEFHHHGGLVKEKRVIRPIVGWQGDHPVVMMKDGSLKVFEGKGK